MVNIFKRFWRVFFVSIRRILVLIEFVPWIFDTRQINTIFNLDLPHYVLTDFRLELYCVHNDLSSRTNYETILPEISWLPARNCGQCEICPFYFWRYQILTRKYFIKIEFPSNINNSNVSRRELIFFSSEFPANSRIIYNIILKKLHCVSLIYRVNKRYIIYFYHIRDKKSLILCTSRIILYFIIHYTCLPPQQN